MIVLDTNIVSNFMQRTPDLQVCQWLDAQPEGTLYLPSVVVSEIYFGLGLLADGRKRTQLTQSFEMFMARGFANHILDFDMRAAKAYGAIRSLRQQQGKPMSICDAQIAAIAQVRHFALATRNIKDFAGCGIVLVNPFESVEKNG